MRTAALAVLVFALVDCTCSPTPVGPTPPTTITCDNACARLAELQCPAAQPTPQGATCVQVCQNAEQSGLATWGVKCIVGATSCAQADRCGGPP